MFIKTQNEIISLMPTSRWDRPDQLLGYLEEEERVALEPLLGTPLYEHLVKECRRMRGRYVDITPTTITPDGQADPDPGLPYADVTEHVDALRSKRIPHTTPCALPEDDHDDVPELDMKTVELLRICQQIEFYKMLSHKAGLLTVSFNEGGGMNVVSADGYDGADEKAKDRVVKDAFMSAGRAVDSLLLFLEADAKGDKIFTALWQEADAFYLHKDLLFQTARVMNEFLPLKGGRMDYVELVRDIRFCQNTYLKPRIGAKLLAAVIDYANLGGETAEHTTQTEHTENEHTTDGQEEMVNVQWSMFNELLSLLRTALAFYVESRRVELGPKQEKLARRDSMTDAQQAMAMACQFVEENLDALGDAAVGTPIYNAVHARMEQEERDRQGAQAACERRRREACEASRRKLFTAFPHTHRTPEHK